MAACMNVVNDRAGGDHARVVRSSPDQGDMNFVSDARQLFREVAELPFGAAVLEGRDAEEDFHRAPVTAWAATRVANAAAARRSTRDARPNARSAERRSVDASTDAMWPSLAAKTCRI